MQWGHVRGKRLEAWRSTLIKTGVEGNGTPHEASATRCGSSTVTIKEIARGLQASAWKTVTSRPGMKHRLRSRFAAVRVRPAHRDYWRSKPHPEEWLLVEWPREDAERAVTKLCKRAERVHS
jgi:SRSO17 transposase